MAVKIAKAGKLRVAERTAKQALKHTREENALRTGMALVWVGEALHIVRGSSAADSDCAAAGYIEQSLANARASNSMDVKLHTAQQVAAARLYTARGARTLVRRLLQPRYTQVSEHQEVARQSETRGRY